MTTRSIPPAIRALSPEQLRAFVATIVCHRKHRPLTRYVATLVTMDCDNCNSLNPECDESGRPYDCYACANSGYMTLPAGQWKRMADEQRAQLDEQAQAQGFRDRRQQDEMIAHTNALRARVESNMRRNPGAAGRAIDDFDDIPF